MECLSSLGHFPALLTSPCVHEIEHHSLFIIEESCSPAADNLVAHIEQCRNHLETSCIHAILMTQGVHQLKGVLCSQISARAYSFYAQPDDQLMAHLLENHHILISRERRTILTCPGRDIQGHLGHRRGRALRSRHSGPGWDSRHNNGLRRLSGERTRRRGYGKRR